MTHHETQPRTGYNAEATAQTINPEWVNATYEMHPWRMFEHIQPLPDNDVVRMQEMVRERMAEQFSAQRPSLRPEPSHPRIREPHEFPRAKA